MTITCAVCKKQPIPFDKTRSFHQFPHESELKKKWMAAIEVTCLKNCWRVCSDHFSSTSFHDQNGYNNSRRRLLPNAVPKKASTTVLSKVMNENVNFEDERQRTVFTETHVIENKTDTNLKTTFDDLQQCVKSSEKTGFFSTGVYSIKRKCDIYNCDSTLARKNFYPIANSQNNIGVLISPDLNKRNASGPYSPFKKLELETVPVSWDGKRKLSNTDEVLSPTKKFCFKDGSQMRCITRADFVSDEAWNKFLKYTVTRNHQVEACRKKILRKDKKIENFEELAKTLQRQKTSAAAQYLQVH